MAHAADPVAGPKSQSITDWIRAFYRELGWAYDPAAGLAAGDYASPKATFEAREAELQKQLDSAEENARAELAKKHQTAADRLKNIATIEGGLDAALTAIGQEITRLEAERDLAIGDGPADALFDKDAFRTFAARCKECEGLVNHVATQTMRVPKPGGGPMEFDTLTMINKAERLALLGKVQTAMLMFESGKSDAADNRLEEVRSDLQRYIKVRSGNVDLVSKVPPQTAGILGRTGETISMAQAASKAAWDRGFERIGTRLTDYAEKLRKEAEDFTRTNPGKTPRDMDDACGRTMSELSAIVESTWMSLRDIDATFEDIERIGAAMRMNGFATEAEALDAAMTKLIISAQKVQNGPMLNDTARNLRDEHAAILKAKRDEALKANGLDAAAMAKSVDDLKARHQKFFELGVLSSVSEFFSTPRDPDTGDKLQRIDNSDLPRESVNELDLKIQALTLLNQTGSVEAMKLAQGKIDEVKALFDAIDKDPKLFANFESRIEKIEKRVTTCESKFARIEIAKRNEFAARAKAVRGSYKTDDPAETTKTLTALETELDAYEKMIAAVKESIASTEKVCVVIEKKMAEIGAILKSLKPDAAAGHPKALTGNFGDQATKLAAIRELAGLSTEKDTEEAKKQVVALAADVRAMRELLDKRAEIARGGDPQAAAKLKGFLEDASKGQAEHDRHAAQEKPFKTRLDKLKSDAAALKKIITSSAVKGDPGEVDTLESQAKALETEMKASKAYADGIVRLAELERTCKRLRADADATSVAVTGGLEEAAVYAAVAVATFESVLKDFYQGPVLRAAGDEAQLKARLGDGAPAKIAAFLDGLRGALPTAAATTLKNKVKEVADESKPLDVRRAARAEALKALRVLTSYVNGFKPLGLLMDQPFGAAIEDFAALKNSLPRLEIRLLTALGD